MSFANSPLLWILAGLAGIAAIYAVRAFLGYRRVRQDAAAEYAFRASENMHGSELPFADFESVYLRANGPRAQAFMAAGLGAIVLLTFPMLRLADLVMKGVWRLSGEDRTFEPTFLVYQFGIFFLMIAFWATVGYFTARAYHNNAPLSFEEELRFVRNRG